MFSFIKSAGRFAALISTLWLTACIDGGPSINTGKPVAVALLVPAGSGKPGDAQLARNLENAARLAIADLDGVKIDLRVYHTAGQASQAAAMATKAVNEGAKIILGPVFAQSANAAGVAVARRNVNLLAFSNNTQIAGGNVFVLGHTFQNSADRLVRYAAAKGRSRIVVVHPVSAAGNIGRDAILRAIAQSGATQAGIGSYAFSQEGLFEAIPAIAATTRDSNADVVFFTSDTAGGLPLLTQLLPENRVDMTKVKFIGLTRWDIPPSTLALPGVQGGWFATPDPNLNARFQARYASAYGSNPLPIAGLAYDGIAAIGALVKAGKSGALTRSALTQGAGFVGVNGIFRLRPDGSNQRGLAVAEIQNGQVVIVSPAPRSFGGGS